MENDMNRSGRLQAIVAGGLLVAVLDGVDAVVAYKLAFGMTPVAIYQFVASGLFGDGAAAVVAAGAQRAGELPAAVPTAPRPEVLATRSRLYPDSERTMGWDVGATGLRIVLDSGVPDVVRRYIREDVARFLADHGLRREDVEWYVADLRVDWSEGDPIADLERLWEIYAPQLDAYVTRALDPTAAPSYGVPGDE